MKSAKEIKDEKILEAKKNCIIDAALRIFSSYGYTEAFVEDIAKESGFAKATIYQYFKDKENQEAGCRLTDKSKKPGLLRLFTDQSAF